MGGNLFKGGRCFFDRLYIKWFDYFDTLNIIEI